MNNTGKPLSTQEKRRISKKVTILGSIADAALGFLKVFIGIFYHSHALVIDGIHSFTDVFSDIFVVFITHVSHQEPDENHPYGHEKFETMGSAILGAILIATAGALIYETADSLFSGSTPPVPDWPTYIAAFLSLIIKEFLFHYTFRAGETLQSKLLMANAWHSRSDALSSLVVLVGLIFAGLGYTIVDSVAAIIVSLIILKIGWNFVKESLTELAETSVDKELEQEIKKVILNVEGVQSCHALRTRSMGPKVIVDVNIEVSSSLTASEGHEITAWVIKSLKEKIQDVEDVVVHMDVEDDLDPTQENPYAHSFDDLLPLRSVALKELSKIWTSPALLEQALEVRLHYIKRKISPEIILPIDKALNYSGDELSKLIDQLNDKAKQLPWYGKVRILFEKN